MYNIKGCLYSEEELTEIVKAIGCYLDILEGKKDAPEVPEEIKYTKIQYDIEKLKNNSEELSYLREQLINRAEYLDLIINVLGAFADSSFTQFFQNLFNGFKKKKIMERKHIRRKIKTTNKDFISVTNKRISYEQLKEFYEDAVAAIEEAHTSVLFSDDEVVTATPKFNSNVIELRMNRK